MRKKMWFGIPDEKLQWVPEPLISSTLNNVGYSESVTFENGGSDARSSKAKHKVYNLAFSGEVAGDMGLRSVEKFASGYYGDGYIYLADPYTFHTNVLPPHWATPALVREGWPKISPADVSFITTPENSYDQPRVSVVYSFDENTFGRIRSPFSAVIVIPPTHDLHFGASGSVEGSGIVGVGRDIPLTTNRFVNPSFETPEDETPGSPPKSQDNVYRNCDAEQSDVWASTGDFSLRLTPNDEDNDSSASIGGDEGAVRLGIQLGRTYTVKGKIRLAAPQTGTLHPNARRIAVYVKPGSDPYVETVSEQAPNEAGETELSVTFTVPQGTTEAFVRFYNGASDGNGDVWWDDVLFVEGNYEGEYFDGNNGVASDWTGEPDDSTSTTTIEYRRVDMLDPAGSVRMNTVFPGGVFDYVKIFVSQESRIVTGEVEITSMMAQLHPKNSSPDLSGDHVYGDGVTGMIFVGEGRDESYVYIDPPRKFTSYVLQEVEAWR